MSWVRWLIVALCVVLVVMLLAYARGERQRGAETTEASAAVLIVAGAELA